MPSLRTLAIILGTSSLTLADFYIYKGGSNVPNDGGGGGVATNDAFVFGGVPSCDDLSSAIPLSNSNNDASSSGIDGWACDGCDPSLSIADWDISRFELNDRDDAIGGATHNPQCLTSGCTGGLSGGSYGLESDTMGHQGDCQRTSADEVGPCDPTATDAVQLFFCTTPLTINPQ